MATTISITEELILSYLVGLAPLGTEFQLNHSQCLEDCELKYGAYLSRGLRSLDIAGAIKIISRGFHGNGAIVKVLKRPEDFTVIDAKYNRNKVIRFAKEMTHGAAA